MLSTFFVECFLQKIGQPIIIVVSTFVAVWQLQFLRNLNFLLCYLVWLKKRSVSHWHCIIIYASRYKFHVPFKLQIITGYIDKHVEVKYLGLAINALILQANRIVWLPLYINVLKSYLNPWPRRHHEQMGIKPSSNSMRQQSSLLIE